MTSRPRLFLLAWSRAVPAALLALAACSTAPDLASEGPDGAAGDAGGDASIAAPPGRYLTSLSTVGSGACVGVSLGDVLDEIRAAEPTLADIQTIYNPATNTGDGSFIYPYMNSDGGFDIVFKRGLGDCPAGCTENDYTYFSTMAMCKPVRVGHFHTVWGTGTCLMIDGAPMWNHPPPPDPATVCDQDNAPGAQSGTYQLHAVGQRTPCTALAAAVKAAPIDETVTLVIQQDPANRSTGTVTFTGTGHPLVDGVALSATFQRMRFDAELATTGLSCPSSNSVTARYDFEGYQPGGIEVNEQADDTCMPCKGSMSLTLTP